MSQNRTELPIAADHAGFDLKQYFLENFKSDTWVLKDLGTTSKESTDYPDYADRVVMEMKTNDLPFGILICGSGQGMAMRANRYRGIRAALCWTEEIAKIAREHNDANVLSLPSRQIEPETALKILNTFLSTPFEGGRHQRRVDKINIPTE